MSRARLRAAALAGMLLAAAALAGMLLVAAPARAEEPPAAPDSLAGFLRGLADSTADWFGPASTSFDTAGLSDLAARRVAPPRAGGFPGRPLLLPVLGYHRAEGWAPGARVRMAGPRGSVLTLGGAYGFANRGGRYEVGARLPLARGAGDRGPRLAAPRIGRSQRLELSARYARETVPFAPEHAEGGVGGPTPVVFGDEGPSVYERRGLEARLSAWAGDGWLSVGVRRARERSMALATRYSLFGDRDEVPPVLAATRVESTQPLLDAGWARADWDAAGILEARGDARRWRLRAALGKRQRLPLSWEGVMQLEAGASAARAPAQRRFALGGGQAVASLPYEAELGDHLLLARVDLLDGLPISRRLGVRLPDFLVLQPTLFAQAGAVWSADGRDVLLARPPAARWRGAAGFGLATRLGFPEPDRYARLQLAWPVGADSGELRVELSLRRSFDLVGLP